MNARQVITEKNSTTVSVDGEVFRYSETATYAEIGNTPANITEYVRATFDGRFFRMTVVADEDDFSASGVTRGWYVARWIDADEARKWRESWGVLRAQPDLPQMPGV